jgi:hypothetical protein
MPSDPISGSSPLRASVCDVALLSAADPGRPAGRDEEQVTDVGAAGRLDGDRTVGPVTWNPLYRRAGYDGDALGFKS